MLDRIAAPRLARAWCSRRRTCPRSPRPYSGSGGAGIPVVTLVTDLPAQPAAGVRRHRQPGRRRHRGLPGRAVARRPAGQRAGHREQRRRSAARRSGRWASARAMRDRAAAAGAGRGHRERRPGQRAAATWCSRRSPRDPDIAAVYSIGGGNLATVDAFDAVGPRAAPCSSPTTWTSDNLAPAARRAGCPRCCTTTCGQDLRRSLPGDHAGARARCRSRPPPWPSAIQVVTPYNVPAPPD